jgi:hypothetical protein
MSRAAFETQVLNKADSQIKRLKRVARGLTTDTEKEAKKNEYVDSIMTAMDADSDIQRAFSTLPEADRRAVIEGIVLAIIFPAGLAAPIIRIIAGTPVDLDAVDANAELVTLNTKFGPLKVAIEAGSSSKILEGVLAEISSITALLKFKIEGEAAGRTVPGNILQRIIAIQNKFNFDDIQLEMITKGLEDKASDMEGLLDLISLLVKVVSLGEDTEVGGWDKDPRPPKRQSWTPWDYINAAMNQVQGPRAAVLSGAVPVLGEFNSLIQGHPKYRLENAYWSTAMATWNVLFEADPPSGSDDFTVKFEAWKEKSFQTSKFDVEHVGQILKHKEFGGVSMRILALIEIMLQDDEFAYEGVCEQGQFVARNMDKNAPKLRAAVLEIVKREHWLAREDIPEDLNLVNVVFNISNSLDSRGHFFLDDTAAATTKGFGGADYTWLSRPEATVGYDMNRYAREPKASSYLNAAVNLPNRWHERVAINEVISLMSTSLEEVDEEGTVITEAVTPSVKGKYIDGCITYLRKRDGIATDALAKTLWESWDWKEQVKLGREYAEKVVAEARIHNGHDKAHDLRHWFDELISGKDNQMVMDHIYNERPKRGGSDLYDVPFDVVTTNSSGDEVVSSPDSVDPNDGIERHYQYRDRGTTFPTVYQFYVGQMMKKGITPDQSRIASAGLDRESIFRRRFNTEDYYKTGKGGEYGFAMYLTAEKGWLEALDMIKAAPKPVTYEQLLLNIDKFTGSIGKAKIVPGAHHNMMNMMSYLFLVKQFKWLEPRTYIEFRRTRKDALKKVKDQDSSASGGGIPPHVKVFMTWILDTAVSSTRAEDDDGDLLRPMDPSMSEQVSENVHHRTRGMETGTVSFGWTSLWTVVESVFTSLDSTSGDKGGTTDKISLGTIKWDDQNTDTKESK